jgi:hypothetical protein
MGNLPCVEGHSWTRLGTIASSVGTGAVVASALFITVRRSRAIHRRETASGSKISDVVLDYINTTARAASQPAAVFTGQRTPFPVGVVDLDAFNRNVRQMVATVCPPGSVDAKRVRIATKSVRCIDLLCRMAASVPSLPDS